MKTGLILMTALPPTKGHAFLIDYALEYLDSLSYASNLTVIINGRPNESISIIERTNAFYYRYVKENGIFIYFTSENIVQEPEDHPDFWDIWRKEIFKVTNTKIFDFVFASESYGHKLAEELMAEFIPCNMGRDIVPISASEIRNDPLENFHFIMPEFQPFVRKTVTIFGPESIGKTTLARSLSEALPGHFLPEWAREYLEMKEVGPEVSNAKMKAIVNGQNALQKTGEKLIDKPFIVRDTDLLSTYGYYKLWSGKVPPDCLIKAANSVADLYILLNDKIPFTPDPLRYGGDKRESDNNFWKEILREFDVKNIYEVQSYNPEAQLREVIKACRNFFYRENNFRFER